eukprot:14836087-Heterocapsa_arctica.AAC.1
MAYWSPANKPLLSGERMMTLKMSALPVPQEEGNTTPNYKVHTAKETAKPAHLHTYVDDWRLFKSGDKRAAETLVKTLVTTCKALEDQGMKVSRDKT